MTPTPLTPRGEAQKDPELLRRLQAHVSADYTIEDEMGGGGMSRVFIATDLALHRKVVIKVLPQSLAETVSGDRFRREIMLAAKLQHPHIVPVLAAGELGELPYFIMPYIEGESLRPRIQRGPLSVRETVGIMRDVARALAFAHRVGIVHRDIKPDNILLSAGSAMVTDFGVAKAIADSRNPAHLRAGATITAVGVSLGTPQYMAPEQAAADPTADHRVDLYALGIVGYEMLAGVPPFHGRGPHELLTAQLTESPQPLTARRYDVPAALAQLIMQCLEKNPANRPKTAADMVRVLEGSEAVSGAFAAPPSGARKRASRNRLAAIGGVTALIAIAALWFVTSGSKDPASKLPNGNTVEMGWLEPLGTARPDSLLARTITSDLANALGAVDGLRVTSAPDPLAVVTPDSGRAIAGMRLSGTVQHEGDRVRVNLRLASAKSDSTLWVGRFDGQRADLLALEDEIASGATVGLKKQLTPP
jgi:eukaryotic-like serine/threonine-protein kinase